MNAEMGMPGFDPDSPEFSVVLTCYFEEKSIDEFYSRLSKTMQSLGRSYEIIFVNDGSTDRTFAKHKEFFSRDPHVTAVIDLFKNVGQANARTPGIVQARGKAIIIIDSDLQLDPEELPKLIEKYDEGYDLVTGYRKNRQDPLLRKLPSKIANMIMRKASDTNLRDFGCTIKVMNGLLVYAFEFGPAKPWRLVPVIGMAGRIAEVPVVHHARKHGKSGWTFKKLFAYNMENLVNLSQRPFQLLGMICFAVSIFFVLRIILVRVFSFAILPQVTNGLLLNVMIIGLLITVAILSAIGEFVIRNFGVLQGRPAYIVKEKHSKRDPGPVKAPWGGELLRNASESLTKE
jgi:undecaprenyl-phosphate 4-deoxy-4-formamido-L-arabinose transferase